MTASYSGPVAAEQAHIISPPLPCLTVGLGCLCWYAVFGFLQTCCCALWPNICTLVFSKVIVPEVSWFVQMQFANLSCAAMFFLWRRAFFLQSFQRSHTYSVFFLIILSWTLTFNMQTEACRVWDVALEFFVVFLSIAQSDFGVSLLVRPLLGRFTIVLNVFHLWITFLTVEWWTPNSL